MARPEKQIPRTLEEAVAELKRDPSQALRVAVNDVEVEIRLVGATAQAADDFLGGATWQGESAEELLRIIHQGRVLDEPPEPQFP